MAKRKKKIVPPSGAVLKTEARRFKKFATEQAEPAIREVLKHLYKKWGTYNRLYFSRNLAFVHLIVSDLPSRQLGGHANTTDWGAKTQIQIARRLVLGRDRMVKSPWPSRGLKLFVEDILLHEMIHQYHAEVTGNTEPGHRGHGPEFARICNEIGEKLKLPKVVARTRRGKRKSPQCTYWPHTVRPANYYAPDVDPSPLMLPPKQKHKQDWSVVFKKWLDFLEADEIPELSREIKKAWRGEKDRR